MLQPTHVELRVLARKHLRNIIGSSSTGAIRLNLGVAGLGLPQCCHGLRLRDVLVLEQGMVVQGDLRVGITGPSSFICPDPSNTTVGDTTEGRAS